MVQVELAVTEQALGEAGGGPGRRVRKSVYPTLKGVIAVDGDSSADEAPPTSNGRGAAARSKKSKPRKVLLTALYAAVHCKGIGIGDKIPDYCPYTKIIEFWKVFGIASCPSLHCCAS